MESQDDNEDMMLSKSRIVLYLETIGFQYEKV